VNQTETVLAIQHYRVFAVTNIIVTTECLVDWKTMEPRTLDGELQDLDGGVQGEPVIERALRGHCIVLCIKRIRVYLLGYSVNNKNEVLTCCALNFCVY